MHKKLLSILLAMAMVLSMVPAVFAADSADIRTGAAADLGDLSGKTVILHSNDVHGAVAGYAYVAKLKADYAAAGADVILVDDGDFTNGNTYVSYSKGLSAVKLMNAAGYDVVTLGNHEFDFGYEQLVNNMKEAKFAVVCSDVLNSKGKTIFNANYTVKTAGGLKIGFFGMETPETQTKVNPGLIQGITFLTKDTKTTFYDAAKAQVKALKNCDLVICMAHLGVDAESEPYRSYDLAKAVSGIDFIIDGHSHTVMTKGENGEAIQSTGTEFANVGVIVIDNKTKKIEDNYLVPFTAPVIEVAEDLTAAVTYTEAADETVKAQALDLINEVQKAYGVKFAVSTVTLNGAKAPNGNRDSETNNGDLITDAMLWSVLKEGSLSVDDSHVLAITNGGGIRAAINPGDVTKNNINTVLPFGNTVAVVYVTGAELLEALEASTYCTPNSVGGFPQAAGIKFTINTNVEYDANAETYPASTYYGPASIKRVTIESINGKAFDAEATYAVVTNNFCAAGGDTYYAFKAASSQFDTGIPLDEAVMSYVTEKLGGTIGEEYAAPQGRITVVTNPFKDVAATSWFKPYVLGLYTKGIINGTSASTFEPEKTLTWAQALKTLLVANGSLKAEDAVGADWDKNTVACAVKLGIVEEGFDASEAITRLSFCRIAAKLYKLEESKTESKFSDCDDAFVMTLNEKGVINGVAEGKFGPSQTLTRAQISKILFLLEALDDAA